MINLIKEFLSSYKKIKQYNEFLKRAQRLGIDISIKNNLLPVLLASVDLNSFIKTFDSLVIDVSSYEKLFNEIKLFYKEETNYKDKQHLTDTIMSMEKVLFNLANFINEYMIVKEKILRGPVKITIVVENK